MDPIMFDESIALENMTFVNNEETSLLNIPIAVTFIIIAFIGLITNCINIKIFNHKQYPTTTLSVYLIILSFLDLILLLTSGIFSKIHTLVQWHGSMRLTSFYYRATVVLYPISTICFTSSTWITGALSAHYLTSIASPLKYNGNRIPRRTIGLLTIFLILIACLVNIPNFFQFRIVSRYDPETDSFHDEQLSSGRTDGTYRTLMTAGKLILMFMAPYGVLITALILIYIEARTQFWLDNENGAENQRFLPHSSYTIRRGLTQIEIRKRFVVIMLICIHMVVNLPWVTFELSSAFFDLNSGNVSVILWWHEVSEACLVIYMTVKMLIYYYFDEHFRMLFPGF